MTFRFTVFVKSIVPLQAYVSDKVLVLSAPSPFSKAECSMGEEGVHLCTVP